uniref:(northern house mosquito) hypothetical protein n=1 Tax=Culex pipiens TaxID=7175 RepID=A0A8D8PDX8_CULPI
MIGIETIHEITAPGFTESDGTGSGVDKWEPVPEWTCGHLVMKVVKNNSKQNFRAFDMLHDWDRNNPRNYRTRIHGIRRNRFRSGQVAISSWMWSKIIPSKISGRLICNMIMDMMWSKIIPYKFHGI